MQKENIYQSCGKRIREERRHHGLTQQDLAEKARTSTNYIGHVERGTKRPSLRTLKKITDVLEIQLKDLFDTISRHGGSKKTGSDFTSQRILYLLTDTYPADKKIILSFVAALRRKELKK